MQNSLTGTYVVPFTIFTGEEKRISLPSRYTRAVSEAAETGAAQTTATASKKARKRLIFMISRPFCEKLYDKMRLISMHKYWYQNDYKKPVLCKFTKFTCKNNYFPTYVNLFFTRSVSRIQLNYNRLQGMIFSNLTVYAPAKRKKTPFCYPFCA